jgi:hypothetical protein
MASGEEQPLSGAELESRAKSPTIVPGGAKKRIILVSLFPDGDQHR